MLDITKTGLTSTGTVLSKEKRFMDSSSIRKPGSYGVYRVSHRMRISRSSKILTPLCNSSLLFDQVQLYAKVVL